MNYYIKIFVVIIFFCVSLYTISAPKKTTSIFLTWFIERLPKYTSEGAITIEYSQQEDTLSIALNKKNFGQLSIDWACAKRIDKSKYTQGKLNHRIRCAFDKLAKNAKNNLLKIGTRKYKFINVKSNAKLLPYLNQFNPTQKYENDDISYLDDLFYLNGK